MIIQHETPLKETQIIQIGSDNCIGNEDLECHHRSAHNFHNDFLKDNV